MPCQCWRTPVRYSILRNMSLLNILFGKAAALSSPLTMKSMNAFSTGQGELATTRRLGELHREAAEGRQKKVAELEGIVQEFRQHIKVRDPRGCALRPGDLPHPQIAMCAAAGHQKCCSIGGLLVEGLRTCIASTCS